MSTNPHLTRLARETIEVESQCFQPSALGMTVADHDQRRRETMTKRDIKGTTYEVTARHAMTDCELAIVGGSLLVRTAVLAGDDSNHAREVAIALVRIA